MSDRLAIHGGKPVLDAPLPPYAAMGAAERAAVERVMESGTLSGFYGSWSDEFWGGPEVQGLEREWAARFGVPHAVTVNSATSGLIAAMAAIGLSPGDEVVVPPLTMSATVVAPLFYGGIPVFVDVDAETFCLGADAVRAAITPKTRAIVAVDLFGHPAPLAELRELADGHGIYLIEDAAQAPLAAEAGRLAGTVGHIGIFSLNYHKHIHTGEGGVVVTHDDELARRVQLVRNHGENVVEHLGMDATPNMVGQNLRLTELQAAIGRAQLAAIDLHVTRRERIAERLTAAALDLEGLAAPVVKDSCRHVYYQWVLRVDEERLGIPRDVFSAALRAEGFPNDVGYVRPLYRLPLFRDRTAFGTDGWPFTLSERRYDGALCPVAERLHRHELVLFEPCAYGVEDHHVEGLAAALHKVHRHRRDLVVLQQ